MLNSLHIENIAVIEKADIELGPGFNVLTGETGAGKSIVIDSIGAVLGGRTSRELVRTGSSRALVSAVFSPENTEAWFQENDIEPGEELIIQRRISTDGKSSCRVNGVPVTVQQLHSLGSLLLDIHGQNDGRQLLDESRHLAYLDSFAGDGGLRDAFAEKYRAYREIKGEIERLSMDELEKERLTQNLGYQIAELEKAQLSAGEEDELLAKRELMHNSGRLTEALDGAYTALYEADGSAVSMLAETGSFLSRAQRYAPELSDALKAVNDARYMLEDAAERINDLRQSMDFSPEEYDRVESRLSLLRRLEKRYNTDEKGLIELLEESRRRLDEIEYAADTLLKLEKRLEAARKDAMSAAAALSAARRAAASELEKRIVAELKYLSMPSVRFLAELRPVEEEPGFDASGCDRLRFLMSANAGEEPGRISRIASGGELSRIMLAMKSVFARADHVPSLVFDEIDTGVSGIAAQRVGEKMAGLARCRQVICITHLPQIAALADCHFSISKAEKDGRTVTSVTPLDREGRLRELARLHGGDIITETTLKSAAEQLDAAARFKEKL